MFYFLFYSFVDLKNQKPEPDSAIATSNNEIKTHVFSPANIFLCREIIWCNKLKKKQHQVNALHS